MSKSSASTPTRSEVCDKKLEGERVSDDRNTLSPPLFTLPEHQVVEALLPELPARQLAVSAASASIRTNPQLVPIAINPDLELIYFADLGSYRYREWQHIYSIQQLAQDDRITDYFSTSVRLLDEPHLLRQTRAPRGFILHVSRCGSTLLGKALARADGIGIINQPAILQHGFWAWISGNWMDHKRATDIDNELNRTRFRNLIELLCQQRRTGESHIFIKLISWNALYVDFIQACFPDTPMMYMYRNPVEVIASVLHETTAILLARNKPQAEFLSGLRTAEMANLTDLEYLSACYAHCFDTVMHARTDLKLVNYANFKADTMQQILADAFDLKVSVGQLQQMLEQFQIYSKDDQNTTSFKDDSHRKRNALTAQQIASVDRYCQSSWQQMLNSAQNIRYQQDHARGLEQGQQHG